MSTHTVSQPPDMWLARELVPGDRIAARFLPDGGPVDVVFTVPYSLRGEDWTYVVFRHADDGRPDGCPFVASARIPLTVVADRSGFDYSREADDPTPVSPARVPLHTGGVVDGGQLVDETERCVASLHIPTPGESCLVCGAEGMRYGEHLEVCAGSTDGVVSAQCACGVEVDGFDSFVEARAELAVHIAAASAN